jgi:hypothetical protein
MWVLFEDYPHMIHAPLGPDDDSLFKKPDFFILQQYRTSQLVPPAFSGWQLVENDFSPVPPSIFGLRIGNTPPGYQYAIYKRIAPQE